MPRHPNLQEWTVQVRTGTSAGVTAKAEVMTKGRQTGHEYVAVYEDADPSKVLVATTGTPDSCGLAESQVEAALHRGKCALFHNHPSNRPFSVADYIGMIDRYPSTTVHANGHDGVSDYTFTTNVGATGIGAAAETVWMLTNQYALAMDWLRNGELSADDDWAARHGIALGLEDAKQGTYVFSHFPQRGIAQSTRLCDVAQSYIVRYMSMVATLRSAGNTLDHVAISNALAWLTKANAPSGLFHVTHPALKPQQSIAQQLITDPAFKNFFP
jgi:hypothetical protein